MNTPTKVILANSSHVLSVTDKSGRTLKVRRLNAIDHLRLLKAAGPELSRNDAWLNMAALAFSVTEIDRVPRTTPSNEQQIEAAVSELDDIGLEAVADALNRLPETSLLFDGPPEGNFVGTPT